MWAGKNLELEKKFRPTREQRRAVRIYLDSYSKWKLIGMPNSGGYGEQEAEWVDSIEVMEEAYRRAEYLLKQEADEKQKREQESQGGKRRRKL